MHNETEDDFAAISAARSFNMSQIKAKNTKPEMIVRRILYSMGYRYRLHAPELPGKPDIVFRSRKKAIFVHGCFWHRHPDCSKATTPKTRHEFWQEKFKQNVRRDRAVLKQLSDMDWSCLVVWECETRDIRPLARRLSAFLSD
jgi:DNA mismatch endonuclease (patch repair protein)